MADFNTGNLDPRVASMYAPMFQQGMSDIQRQGQEMQQQIYGQLARRGMLSSGLLPTSLIGVNEAVNRGISNLYAQTYLPAMQESLALQEAKRQEEEAKNWALLNTAIKFASPLFMTPIYGLSYKLAQGMLGNSGSQMFNYIFGER